MATTNKKINFSYFERKQDFTAALQAELANNIVFVEDTKEVFTHGEFFGIRNVTLNYDSSTTRLQLKDGGVVVSEMDASAFVKDGMLDSVELVKVQESGVTESVPYLKFIFNTDSGKTAVRLSVSDLVDSYDGSSIALTQSFAPASSYSAPAAGDSVDVAVGKLLKGHSDNVTALSNKQETITGAATTVTMNDLTPDRALASSGSGKIAVSTTTATELGYVHGVTSGIQAQIDAVSALAAKGLKQVDLATYQGTDGEIVQYIGATSGDYTNGYVYKFSNIVIPKLTPYLDTRELTGYEDYVSQTIYVGTKVVNGWQEYQGTPVTYGRACTFAIADLYVGATVLFSNSTKGVGIVGSILSDKFIVAVGSDSLEVPIPSTPYYTYDIYYMHDIYGVADAWAYLNVNQILRYNETSELWNAEYTTKNVSDLHPFSNNSDYPIVSGWRRINVQPSSEGAVSDLETRMTAAEAEIKELRDSVQDFVDDITVVDNGNTADFTLIIPDSVI